jgi:serine/threonine-protein kinase
VQNEVLRPSVFWPEIPPALEAIILRCVSAQPDQRYRGAAEFGRALEKLSA